MLETWPTAALAERHRRRQLPSGGISARRVRAGEQLGAHGRAQQRAARAPDERSSPGLRLLGDQSST